MVRNISDKIKVFISSMCNEDVYKVARRGLKELLLNTGFVDVYVFEDSHGSSVSVEESFMRKLESCDLCVFLIDTSKEISEGVMKEHKRVQELNKKSIYFFYDEYNKDKIPLQIEIENKKNTTYKIVPKFADFVNEVFESIIQDVVDLYKYKNDIINEKIEVNEINNINDELIKIDTYAETNLNKKAKIEVTYGVDKIDKNRLNLTIDKFKKEFIENEKKTSEENCNALDKLCSEFADMVLYKKKFEDKLFKKLEVEILKLYKGNMRKIIGKRLNAIRLYYNGSIEECTKELQKILEEKQITNVPKWIFNDIAIDLRNIGTSYDILNNNWNYQIMGQKYLDDSEEALYYPLIDRIDCNLRKRIMDDFIEKELKSPYSITIANNYNEVFENIAMRFYTALINGSITHLKITLERINKILLYFNLKYNDHRIYLQTIRYCVLLQKDKEISNLLRVKNTDIFNNKDIMTIYNDIQNINIMHEKTVSRCILLKYFRYYFSDQIYDEIFEKECEEILNWLDKKNRIHIYAKYYFEMLYENIDRADTKKVLKVVLKILKINAIELYDDAFKLLKRIEYTVNNEVEQRKILEYFMDIILNINNINNANIVRNAIIMFRKTATIDDKMLLDEFVHKYMKNFSDIYDLETCRDINVSKQYIFKCIQSIKKDNEEQGKNGVYKGALNDEFYTIANIIQIDDIELNTNVIKKIINVCIETLINEKQTISAKNKAIQLMIFLRKKFDKRKIWRKYVDIIKANSAIFLQGRDDVLFDRESKELMRFNMNLLHIIFLISDKNMKFKVITDTFKFSKIDKIKSLKYLKNFLENINYLKYDNEIIESLLQYILLSINESEIDIKFWATMCLIELTYSPHHKIAIEQLTNIMNSANSDLRISIISRLKNIYQKENDEFLDFVLNKAKIDNNFLVRKIANEYKKEEDNYGI